MPMRTWVKATVGAMVLAVLGLHSSAASHERKEQEWWKNFGLFFHHITTDRDQGTTLKDHMEVWARATREQAEINAPVPQELSQTMGTLTIGIVFHVYLHPAYRAFGPERNRNRVQSRCERIGAERFMLELDHWWRDFARNKLHQAPQ
jgi:hypothetical protein